MPTDYLLRLFEWTKQMLIEIERQQKEGGATAARKGIEKACLQITGLSFEVLRHYSPETLLELMKRGSDAYQKSILLAQLFLQYAKINAEEGNTEHEIASSIQAFCLLSASVFVLNPNEKSFYNFQLKELTEKLSRFKDDPYIRTKLTSFQES